MRKTVSMQSLVKISKGMLSRCIIRKSYYLPDENIAAIKETVLFPSGLDLVRSVLPGFTKSGHQRIHLLWGGCGVGKSHLCLALANIIGRNRQDEAYRDITGKVRALDSALYKSIEDSRSAMNKVLVTFPEILAGGDSRFRSPLLMSLNGALYQEGLDYLPKTEGTLVEIISDLIDFLSGQTDFRGLAIFFDDFDRFLSQMNENPDHPELKEFREFKEYCRTSEFPIVFVGICSKSPKEYMKTDVTLCRELFDDIHYYNLYSRDATMETLIKLRILEHPESQDSEELYQHEDYAQLETMLQTMGLYQDLSPQLVKERVLWGTYPLHPLTLFCLPRICERLSSPDKCFTTFFNDTSPGGLRYFIENIATVQPSGRLSLYTPDYIYSYFEKNIKEDARLSAYVEAMEKSYVRVGDIPNSRRILRLITTMQIVDSLKLPTTEENIINAIHMGEKENKQIKESLKKMAEKETLHYDENKKIYEIPVEKKIVSFTDLLEDMKSKVGASFDTYSYLNRYFRPRKLVVKHYNHRFFSQRYAYGKYIQAKDLQEPGVFDRELQDNYARGTSYTKGDVLILYCPVRSHDEIAQIQQIIGSGTLQNPQIILAISKKLMELEGEVIELESLQCMKKLESSMNEPGSADEKKSLDLSGALHRSLKEKLEAFDKAENLKWYWQGHDLKESDMTGDMEGISKILREVFHKAPLLKYRTLFTMTPRKGLRKAVKDAVETLLKNRLPISLPDYTENESEKIIKACLVDKEILEQVGEDSYGKKFEVAATVRPSSPFYDLWCACGEELKPGEQERKRVLPTSFVRRFIGPPYGFSFLVIQLVAAAFLRKIHYAIEFRCGVRHMQGEDESNLRTMPLGYETIEAICRDPEDWVIYTYQSTEFDSEALQRIREIFTPKAACGTSPSDELKSSILEWFRFVPLSTRQKNFSEKHIKNLAGLLQDPDKTSNTRSFLQTYLLEALEFSEQDFSWKNDIDSLVGKLKNARDELSQEELQYKSHLYPELSRLFEVGQDRESLEKAVPGWHRAVSMQIRNREELPPDESAFLEAYREGLTLDELCFYVIPEATGIPSVNEWLNDRTSEVLSWIRKAKLSLQFRNLEGFGGAPSDVESEKQDLDKFVDVLANNLGLSQREKAELIEGCLEKLAQ